MRKWLLGAIAAGMMAAAPAAAQEDQATITAAIHAGRLLADPGSGRVLAEQTILVSADGAIAAVEAGYLSPAGAQIIDLRDQFVLPGLIDSHVHITSEQSSTWRQEAVTRSNAFVALRGARFARLTAEAGFTTVADLGSPPEAIFALRDAIRAGLVPGPRIIAAGTAITPHGGHADVQGYRPEITEVLRSPGACSGPDQCRRVVREMIQAGADIIKVTATGGVLSDTQAGLAQQLMDDELQAIVQAAHAMGRRVVAHAHGLDGVNAALRAGVDGIEHGTYLDETSIALFRRTNAYLTPTVLAGVTVVERAQIPGALSPAQRMKALEVGPRMLDMLRRAREGGVRVAFGTDSGVSRHGENAREFELMAQAGYTPLQALQTATVAAADHFGLSDTIGRIAPGMSADIIAVDGDPLRSASALRAVSFVMTRGQVLRPREGR